MNTHDRTETPLHAPLTLWTPDEQPIALRLLSSTAPDGDHGGHVMRVRVSRADYDRVANDALFHLASEMRGVHEGPPFSDDDLELTLLLRPDLLSISRQRRLDERGIHDLMRGAAERADAERAGANGASRDDELAQVFVATESWLCLSVTQRQAGTEVGFKTFWSYLDPTAFFASDRAGEMLARSIIDFATDWTKASLLDGERAAVDRAFDRITEYVRGFASRDAASHHKPEPEPEPEVLAGRSIYAAMTEFFRQECWPFVEIEGASALSLSFRGSSGTWSCLAQARERQEQLLFYSLCPVSATRDQLPVAAEVIARANAGLILGNFELDYEDGEIRYKTSIDVEGDRLTSALMRQLVYTNIRNTDRYLPAIRAVLERDEAPSLAIARIEGAVTAVE